MSDGSETPEVAATGVVGLVLRELVRCGLDASETLIVYDDAAGDRRVAEAFVTAGQVLGATVLDLRIPPRTAPDGGGRQEWWAAWPDGLTEVLATGDLVVDLSGGGLFHTGRQGELLERGTRILRVREPVGRLRALFPIDAVRRRVEASVALLESAQEMHVRSPAGTDLRVRIAGRPVSGQYGYTDRPGRWDHWGTAIAVSAPAEGEGEGVYVLEPGDVVFLTATVGRYVREPLAVTFERGRITGIAGGIEAGMLEGLIARSPTDDARRLSHIGWGCDDRADWNAVDLYGREGGGGADVRSVSGAFILAFGANLDLGGTSDTNVHVDLPARRPTVTLDGREVVRDGRLVASQIAPDA
jgi:2,5-dihydroxypyridine 5,6-dioxygenase